ncbi:TPA: hypothetical protein HA225_00205 [Candidatus Micrarchaeota archaeon]|nr:hypothetical protein [Candidatus Micrarchaeota archaeon]
MRNLVGIALAALFILLFALLFLTDSAGNEAAEPQPPASNESAGQVSFGFYSAHLADSGNGKAAVLGVYLYPEWEEGKVRIFCSGAELQKNMLILSHPAAPGIGGALGEQVAAALSRCGFSSRTAGLQDALSSRNSVIIAPTGAIPKKISENYQEITAQNSRAVALVSLPGRLISENMSLEQGSGSQDIGEVAIEPGEEKQAASEAAMAAMLPGGANGLSAETSGGNLTFIVPINSSKAYCRAVFISDSGACRSSDSFGLESPAGRLKGPVSLLAGEKGAFEFSLPSGSELGRSLRFHASTLKGKTEVARQEIPGGKISGGWASVFSIAAPSGGKYVLVISDQFGREHAKAFFESAGFDVFPVSQQGNRLEYGAKFGGMPINGIVSVRMDSGEPKDYYSSNGTLVVYAAPPAGSHTLHFSYRGLAASHGFIAEGGGLFESYVRLGIPALAFLAAVFLLLRARRKTRYRITFPHRAQGETRQVFASPSDLLSAWAAFDRKIGGFFLPCSAGEISGELPALLGEKKGTAINSQSAQEALQELVDLGIFSESEEFFIPKSRLKGFTAEEARSLRLIHDLLLERGIPFKGGRTISVKKAGLELALFSGKKAALGRMGKARRAVVFESRGEVALFEKSLALPDAENVRIKIALSNGKLVFVAANRQELEKLLP